MRYAVRRSAGWLPSTKDVNSSASRRAIAVLVPSSAGPPMDRHPSNEATTSRGCTDRTPMSAAAGVTLVGPRVRSGTQQPRLPVAGDPGQPSEHPVAGPDDEVAAADEGLDRLAAQPVLD